MFAFQLTKKTKGKNRKKKLPKISGLAKSCVAAFENRLIISEIFAGKQAKQYMIIEPMYI